MKLAILYSLSSVALLATVTQSRSHAAVTAYEPFAYEAGTLAGQTSPHGGFGPWATTAGSGFNVEGPTVEGNFTGNLANPNPSAQRGGIGDTNTPAGSNRVGQGAGGGIVNASTSTLTQTYGADLTRVVFSFAREYGGGAGQSSGGINLSLANANPIFLGDPAGTDAPTDEISVLTSAGRFGSGVASNSGVTFLQAAFDFGTIDTLTFKVFNTSGTQLGSTVTTDVTGFSFDTVTLSVADNAGVGLDQLTIDVTAVPEPTTFALASLLGGGLLCRHRR